MRVAFLGLGIMGQAMATNLVKAGHEVSVWNRSAGKGVEGARAAASPADAAGGVDVIWMCVSDTRAVENVLFGPQGATESLAEGMVIADSSTISPSATRQFAERVRAKGVQYVDAPMTGSKAGAANGTLIFMVGGEESAVEKLKPLFAVMGKKIFQMGEIGKGHIIAFNILNIGRLKLGPAGVGAAKNVLAICLKYAKQRKAFGSSIAEFGAIQHKLAEMAIRIFVAESMTWRVGGLFENQMHAGSHSADGTQELKAELEGKTIRLFPQSDGTVLGLMPVPVAQKPGAYSIHIRDAAGAEKQQGSWWEAWAEWMAPRAGDPPPRAGARDAHTRHRRLQPRRLFLQKASVRLGRGLIALGTQRNVELVQFYQHLALCLEGSAWIKVEVAFDQPAQVVPARTGRGLFRIQPAADSLQVSSKLLKGTAVVQVAEGRFSFECRGHVLEKIGCRRLQFSHEGGASLTVAHVQRVGPAHGQFTGIGLAVAYEELSED